MVASRFPLGELFLVFTIRRASTSRHDRRAIEALLPILRFYVLILQVRLSTKVRLLRKVMWSIELEKLWNGEKYVACLGHKISQSTCTTKNQPWPRHLYSVRNVSLFKNIRDFRTGQNGFMTFSNRENLKYSKGTTM